MSSVAQIAANPDPGDSDELEALFDSIAAATRDEPSTPAAGTRRRRLRPRRKSFLRSAS